MGANGLSTAPRWAGRSRAEIGLVDGAHILRSWVGTEMDHVPRPAPRDERCHRERMHHRAHFVDEPDAGKVPVADAVLALPRADPRRVGRLHQNIDERCALPLVCEQAVIGPDIEPVERDQAVRVVAGGVADFARLHLEVRTLGEEEGSSFVDGAVDNRLPQRVHLCL